MAQVDLGSVLEDLDAADVVTHDDTELGPTRIAFAVPVPAAAAAAAAAVGGEDDNLCQTRVVDVHPSSI